MGVFLLKRFATFLATLLVASAVVFAVLELLPGNAAEVILGDTATPEAVAALQAKLGLDRPALQRYTDWVGGWLQGRSADSVSYGSPTAELISERLRVTVPLAVMAMALTVTLALGLGVYAASRHNRAGDFGVMAAGPAGAPRALDAPPSGRRRSGDQRRGAISSSSSCRSAATIRSAAKPGSVACRRWAISRTPAASSARVGWRGGVTRNKLIKALWIKPTR